MEDQVPPRDERPLLGEVSYSEAGNVAFAFLVLHVQAGKVISAVETGDMDAIKDLAAGLRNSLRSADQYVSPARRMAKWNE